MPCRKAPLEKPSGTSVVGLFVSVGGFGVVGNNGNGSLLDEFNDGTGGRWAKKFGMDEEGGGLDPGAEVLLLSAGRP